MKKIGILGHFGFGQEALDGQTVKTHVIADALATCYGESAIDRIDTQGGWRFLLRMPRVLWQLLRRHEHVIMLPAHNGVRIMSPILVLYNLFFRRQLCYVVIGGWLPQFVRRYAFLRFSLRKFDHILVETHHMLHQMEAAGFSNVEVMPNFKPLDIRQAADLPVSYEPPIRLCTFSRVHPEKGIDIAVEAVNACNKRLGSKFFTLDIYGKVQDEPWFSAVMASQDDSVCYRGVAPFHESVAILRGYSLLLFPTVYQGEGFPGTIIDAFSAGLPTVASDMHSCREIIVKGQTGFLFTTGSADALASVLQNIAAEPQKLHQMALACIEEARRYQPQEVIKTLTRCLDS